MVLIEELALLGMFGIRMLYVPQSLLVGGHREPMILDIVYEDNGKVQFPNNF